MDLDKRAIKSKIAISHSHSHQQLYKRIIYIRDQCGKQSEEWNMVGH